MWHGGTECKKTFQWLGLCPGPRWGSLQRSPRLPSWWERDWLPPLQLPPAVGPLDLASPVPHTKIVPPLDSGWRCPCISYRLRLKLVCFPVCRVAFTVFAFKCGVCFFHIVGYISTVVCCLCLCKLRNSALELMLQNFVNLYRQTDVRRASSLNAPYPRGGDIMISRLSVCAYL